MAQANSNNSINSTRRRFLTVSAGASVASVSTLAAAAMPDLLPNGSQIAPTAADDSALLVLEDLIFEQHELATAYDDEIIRLAEIWHAESDRLYREALWREVQAGAYLTPEQRWDQVKEMVEAKEHNRLCRLQEVHYSKMDALVKQMWATPALTPDGRRAKVWVALILLPEAWRDRDDEADYGIEQMRRLLFELVGGEPGAELRDQFA